LIVEAFTVYATLTEPDVDGVPDVDGEGAVALLPPFGGPDEVKGEASLRLLPRPASPCEHVLPVKPT